MPSKKIRNRDKNRTSDLSNESVNAPGFSSDQKSKSKKDDDYKSRY